MRGLAGGANLVCTQPRRLAAIGVAERVAAERDEECGQVVGYEHYPVSLIHAHSKCLSLDDRVFLTHEDQV